MTHTSTEQPEALMRLADNYAEACFDQGLNQRTTDDKPETEREKLEKAIRRMHTRISELEAQLSAIGAGGVEPLRKQAVPVQMPEPDAWRYTTVRDHFRYRGRRVGFAAEYPMLKPEPLYTEQQVRALLAAKAHEDAHHAHPAEGVLAQDAEAKIGQLLALARIMVRAALDADNKTEMQEIKAAIDSEVEFERALRNTLAETQPAANQGEAKA